MKKDQKNKITCPTCQKPDTWQADNPYKPFCSGRCKLIDLGAWASESHKIPGEAVNPKAPEDEEQ